MNIQTARFLLFFVYLSFFAIDLQLINWSFAKYESTDTSMNELQAKFLSLYSGPLGYMLIGLIGGFNDRPEKIIWQKVFVALTVACFWNYFSSWPVYYLWDTAGPQHMSIAWSTDYLRIISEYTSGLAAGSLTSVFLRGNY
jgi:hypothetical protein